MKKQSTEYDRGYVDGYKAGSGGIVADTMALRDQFDDGWKRGRDSVLEYLKEWIKRIEKLKEV